MKIYEQVTRFDPKNGKPYQEWAFKEIRCDFSGKLIDENNSSYPNYSLKYEDSDPCFGSDGEEFAFGKKHKVPIYEFLNSDYHFFTDGCDEDGNYIEYNGCVDMMSKLIKHYMSFDGMCRYSRINTAKKLIEDGTITSEQLYWHLDI